MGTSAPAKNKVLFFRANYNGSVWAIYQGLSGTTAATAVGHNAYTLTTIEEGNYDFQDDGTIKISWTQYNDDETYYNFLDAVKPQAGTTSAGRSEVVLEDGSKLTSGTSSGNFVIAFAYTTESNGKIKTLFALGNVANTSGSFNTKNTEWTKPTLEFQGSLAPADLSIPAALFDMYNSTTNTTGVLDSAAVASAQTIANKKCYNIKYFTKKA